MVNAVKIGITNDLNARIISLEKTWGKVEINKSYFAEHNRNHRYEQAFHLIFTKYNKDFKTGDGYSEFFEPIVISLIKDMKYLDIYLKPLNSYSMDTEVIEVFDRENLNGKQLNMLFTIIQITKINNNQIKIDKLRNSALFNNFNRTSNRELDNEIIEKAKKIGILVKENDNQFHFKPLFSEIKIDRPYLKCIKDPEVNSYFKKYYFKKEQFQNYLKINSKYSKEIYIYLIKYSRNSSWKLNYSDFLKLLDVPKFYSTGVVKKQIIDFAVNDLKEFYPNLKVLLTYEKNTGKRGRPKIETIEFNFKNSD